MVVQLGNNLVGQAGYLTVIERCRQQSILVALLFFDLVLLASDITFVLNLNLNLLCRLLILQARRERRKLNQLFVDSPLL